MELIRLKARPLTKDSFAEFGDVIEMEGATHFPINEGRVERYHNVADVQIDHESGGRAIISYFRTNEARTFPYQFNLIERHPKGSQAFIPLFDAPVVLVVGSKNHKPDGNKLRAFITNGKQGFNFHAGVWHMPLVCDKAGRTFIVVDRAGPATNCDEVTLNNQTIELSLP